jgi:hypothetical protein
MVSTPPARAVTLRAGPLLGLPPVRSSSAPEHRSGRSCRQKTPATTASAPACLCRARPNRRKVGEAWMIPSSGSARRLGRAIPPWPVLPRSACPSSSPMPRHPFARGRPEATRPRLPSRLRRSGRRRPRRAPCARPIDRRARFRSSGRSKPSPRRREPRRVGLPSHRVNVIPFSRQRPLPGPRVQNRPTSSSISKA